MKSLRASGPNYALHLVADEKRTLCGRTRASVNCIGVDDPNDEQLCRQCARKRGPRASAPRTRTEGER